MKAVEAREIVKKFKRKGKKTSDINKVYLLIREAAEFGEYFVCVEDCTQGIVDILIEDGYVITGSNIITITWK